MTTQTRHPEAGRIRLAVQRSWPHTKKLAEIVGNLLRKPQAGRTGMLTAKPKADRREVGQVGLSRANCLTFEYITQVGHTERSRVTHKLAT